VLKACPDKQPRISKANIDGGQQSENADIIKSLATAADPGADSEISPLIIAVDPLNMRGIKKTADWQPVK